MPKQERIDEETKQPYESDDDAEQSAAIPVRAEALEMIASIASDVIDEDDPVNNPEAAESAVDDSTNTGEEEQSSSNNSKKKKPVKLYKSSRLKGYFTLTLASFINYDAAQKSGDVDTDNLTVVSSTMNEERYAMAVAVVSLVLVAFSSVAHLDRITPLEKVWIACFQAGSKVEGALAAFLVIWWTVATGVETSVQGIAGDGKGAYNFYYSTWTCCVTSYWILERWWVAAGWSSLKSFISSWPNRSPAWICIMFLSFITLIIYVDLWQNHVNLDRPQEIFIRRHFDRVGTGQWQWLIIVTVFSFCPAVVFVLIELFRETKADGSATPKTPTEVIIEGICLLVLVVAWIPTVVIATSPRGAASLIGNAYFFTWFMSIFVFEGFIWYIHDKRKETHYALKAKQEEYRRQQEKVLEQTLAIQLKKEKEELNESSFRSRSKRDRLPTEYFDASQSTGN